MLRHRLKETLVFGNLQPFKKNLVTPQLSKKLTERSATVIISEKKKQGTRMSVIQILHLRLLR